MRILSWIQDCSGDKGGGGGGGESSSTSGMPGSTDALPTGVDGRREGDTRAELPPPAATLVDQRRGEAVRPPVGLELVLVPPDPPTPGAVRGLPPRLATPRDALVSASTDPEVPSLPPGDAVEPLPLRLRPLRVEGDNAPLLSVRSDGVRDNPAPWPGDERPAVGP
mmetsp:Transcript_10243/g.29237  ORF Transcript_10243/g.29237 Transcript_10243/m.29237 type:complete len:166 (-) Transcript_10243:142-639(-)